MKHICFFNSLKFWGGGEKFYHEFALGFVRKGYQVSVVSHPESPLTQKAKADGIPTLPIIVTNMSFLNPLKILALARYFRSNGIDTVFFSVSQDLKLAGLAAHWAGVKNIVYRRGLAVEKKNSMLNRYLFSKIATKIIANSEETKRLLLKNLKNSIDPDQVKIIYNGINLDDIDSKPVVNFQAVDDQKKGLVLGNAGRLTAQKGQSYLLEVAKFLKDRGHTFTLFIAGTGELYDELHRQMVEADIQDCVVLLGFVEDIPNFMHSLDLFLLASLWEGFGYVLTEAMAQKKAVIAFNSSSNPEVVDDGKTGVLVETGDVLAFANAVEMLMLDEDLRMKMGAAGRKRVEALFSFPVQLRELENFLLES